LAETPETHYRYVIVLAFTLLLAQSGGLLPNGGFDKADGWIQQPIPGAQSSIKPNEGRSGGAAYLSVEKKPNAMGLWRAVVASPPAGRALRLSLWVKGKDVGQIAGAVMQGWDAEQKEIADFATTQSSRVLNGTFDWTRLECTLHPGPKTKSIHILLMLAGGGEAWFDDVSLTDAGPAKAGESALPTNPEATPGIVLARGEASVTASVDEPAATLLFPMPIDYREQVPLTYELKCDPPEALKTIRIVQPHPGNYVAEATLAPMKTGEKAKITWSSRILVGPRDMSKVPDPAMPKTWPEEARPWLAGTRCVEAADPQVRDAAKGVAQPTVLATIRAAIDRATEIRQGQQGQCSDLGAVQALKRAGSCTSNANLLAALLRASGVPARVLAGYPTWSGPLQTHYIVEAYVPDYGWYPIESTMLREAWPPSGQVQVAVVWPKMEEESGPRYPNAPGVPYLSLTEIVRPKTGLSVVGNIDGKPYCDHAAKLETRYGASKAWPGVLDRARARWRTWIEAAAKGAKTGGLATEDLVQATRALNLGELGK
jgi:hypothetical protein